MGERGSKIKEKTVIARKHHDETMSQWFRDDVHDLNGIGLTFSEWRTIAKLKANNWSILPGQKCKYYTGIDCDGEIYNMYFLDEIWDIVNKYDLAEYAC